MDYLSTRPAKLLTAFSLFSRWSNFRNWYFMSILKCWLSTLMSYLPELRPWMPSSRGSRLPRMWTQPCFCWWVWWQFFCCRFSFLLIFYHDFLQNAQTFWAAPFIGLPRSSCADFFKFASKVYSSISSSFLSIHFSFSGSCAFVYLYICTGSSVGKPSLRHCPPYNFHVARYLSHCFHIEFNEMSACVALYVGSNRLRSRIMLDVDYLLGHRKHIYMVLQ